MLFAYQVPRVRAQETYLAQLSIFSILPRKARLSTTLDNGSEHVLHTKLQTALAMQTYFADPYSSWQRGTNEYTNELLRRYYPKRTDFRDLAQEELNEVVDRLNNIPRKVLQYKTPREVFNEHLFQLLHIG
jgi:IS30 family transposase